MLSAPSLGVKPGRVMSRVSIMGVLPTLLELAGSAAPNGRDGLSMVPLLQRGGAEEGPARAVLERRLDQRVLVVHRVVKNPDHPVAWAVMRGSWKLINDGDRIELYDTAADVHERHNRIREQPAISTSLANALAAFLEQTRPIDSQKVDVLLDSQKVETLRVLGYGD